MVLLNYHKNQQSSLGMFLKDLSKILILDFHYHNPRRNMLFIVQHINRKKFLNLDRLYDIIIFDFKLTEITRNRISFGEDTDILMCNESVDSEIGHAFLNYYRNLSNYLFIFGVRNEIIYRLEGEKELVMK